VVVVTSESLGAELPSARGDREEETMAGRAKQWAVGSRERGGKQQAMSLGAWLVAQLGSRKKRGVREKADL